jgi:hypothetical protein
MEFLLLLGMCVLVILGVGWFGSRRRQFDNDPTLATKDREDLDRRVRRVTGSGGGGGGG